MRTRKKLCWLSALFAIFFGSPLFYFHGMASAKQVVERIDDKIVISEKPIVAEYSGVPKEVPTDIALKIINGEQPEYAKKTITVAITESLLPPPAKVIKTDEFRVWTYNASEKKWNESKRTGPPRESANWWLSAFLLSPVLAILLASVVNGFRNRSSWRLAWLWLTFAGLLYLNLNLGQIQCFSGMMAVAVVLATLFSPPILIAYSMGADSDSSGEMNGGLTLCAIGSLFVLGFTFWVPMGIYSHTSFIQCEWIIGIASVLGLMLSGAIKRAHRVKET